jgi:uncharacterized membrane protein YfcA
MLAGFGASIIGGLAGYGSGLLMPLLLVPLVGPEPVIPVIGIMAVFTNGGRVLAFLSATDWSKVWRVAITALPSVWAGTLFYDSLTGRGVLLLLGTTLLLIIPLRRWLQRLRWSLPDRALPLIGIVYGFIAGSTNGSGVILVSCLMAAGLGGSAVIATDAVISLMAGLVKTGSFGMLGALRPRDAAFGLAIGIATLPGGFVVRFLVDRMSIRLHALLLEGAVAIGGLGLLWRALLA